MIKINVTVKGFKEVEKLLKEMPRKLEEKAVAAGINKTLASAKAEMKCAITEEYNISPGKVGRLLKATTASRRLNSRYLTATLEALRTDPRHRSLNLINFVKRRGSKTKPNLQFVIRKSRGMMKINGMFIGNKGRTVFIRVPGTTMDSRSKYSGTQHAHKIRGGQVIDVPQMFSARRINQRVIAYINRRLPIEMNRAIHAVLKGLIK